jgi:hypothetical protein
MGVRRLTRMLTGIVVASVLASSLVPTGGAAASAPAPAGVTGAAIRFTDVPPGVWFTDPVAWAASEGITTGVTSTTFSPSGITSRAMAVTFLWRLAGEPTEGIATDWFTDVADASWYDVSAHWALQQGITNGLGGTQQNPTRSFGPNDQVTRGQFVTFLWRLAGEPAPTAPVGFRDSGPGAFFFTAAEWAAFQAITTGYARSTNFAPYFSLTRAEAVTFLKRYDNLGLPFTDLPGDTFHASGPFKVGFQETTVRDGTYVQIFYPIDTESTGGLTPIRSVPVGDAFGPPGSQVRNAAAAILPTFINRPLPVELYRDAPITANGADGIVLSSHGFAGDPRFVMNHLSHYASWGYLVIAPSHPGRNLQNIVGGFLTGQPPTVDADGPIDDAVAAIQLILGRNADPGDGFFGRIDTSKIAAEGHSAGGTTIGALRARGVDVKTLIGWATVPFSNAPNVPALVVPSDRDGVVTGNNAAQVSYAGMVTPKHLVELASAGHNPVLDICPIIRADNGLDLPPALASLSFLGQDGCVDGFTLPAISTALIRHLAVAQTRWAFGTDGRDSLEDSFLRRHYNAAVGRIWLDP